MSSRGNKPSAGCQKCRSRKVKCDETRPACQRCVKAGSECVYRDGFDMLLRDQNTAAEQRATQKWRARAQQSGQTSPSQSREQSLSSRRGSSRPPYSTDNAVNLKCSSPLLVPIPDLAINRFFYDYIINPTPDQPVSFNGYLPFLPDMYYNCSTSSPLSAAVMAVSLANFSGRVRSSKIDSNGRNEYAAALRLTKEALTSSTQSRTDETLLAIYLLGMYEVIQFPKHNRGSWDVHLDGLIALVRMQADEKSSNPVSPTCAWISQLVTWQMLARCLRDGIHPPGLRAEWMNRWTDQNTLEARLVDLLFQSADLTATLRNETPSDNGKRWELHQQLHRTLLDCDNWEAEAALLWPFQVQSLDDELCFVWLSDLLDCDGKPTVVHSYFRLWTITMWNIYRTTRLRVELARWIHPNFYLSEDEKVASLEIMVSLVEDICSGIPCNFIVPIPGKPNPADLSDLCSIRAFSLLHPLSLAARSMRDPLRNMPGMVDRLSWVQVVLEHMQHDFSVSGSMECGPGRISSPARPI